MELLLWIGLPVFIIICIRIYLRTQVWYMTPRVADKIIDEFGPQEWFTLEDATERVGHDEMITAFAITHLYNEANMLEYRLNPIDGLGEEHHQAAVAFVAARGMHPIVVMYFTFRIVGMSQRPKRSLTDIMKGALEGVLGPKGLPDPV